MRREDPHKAPSGSSRLPKPHHPSPASPSPSQTLKRRERPETPGSNALCVESRRHQIGGENSSFIGTVRGRKSGWRGAGRREKKLGAMVCLPPPRMWTANGPFERDQASRPGSSARAVPYSSQRLQIGIEPVTIQIFFCRRDSNAGE